MEWIEDKEIYLTPNEIAMHLTHKDIVLDYFISRQPLISQLTGGNILIVNGDKCLNHSGQAVLKFSRKFVEQIESMKEKGYELKNAKVNFIVYWQKEGTEQEVKIILPELYFERKNN
jgi:ATP-dependent DNA helicase RecQ